MFIFYYAVLSEVTPPTALAAVAAAAITGGDVIATMWQALEVHAAGVPGAARVRAHRQRRRTCSCRATPGRSCGPPRCPCVAVAALAAVTGGWIVGPAALAGAAALRAGRACCCCTCNRVSIAIGLGFLAVAVVVHLVTRRPHARATPEGEPHETSPSAGPVVSPPSPWSAARPRARRCGGRQQPTAGSGRRPTARRRARRARADHHRDRQRHRRLLRARRRAGQLIIEPTPRSRRPPPRPARRCRTSSSWSPGEYDIAFSLADTAADAVAGKGCVHRAAGRSRRWPGSTPTTPTSWCSADAGITTMADMRGKRISTGSPKSGTEVIANRLLAGGRRWTRRPTCRRSGWSWARPSTA